MYFNVPNGVKLVGDSAYQGQNDKVTTTMDGGSRTSKLSESPSVMAVTPTIN